MSRIGNKPIPVPPGIDVTIADGAVRVKGKNGELSLCWHPAMTVVWDAEQRQIRVSRPNDQRQSRALHGLTRALIANMVNGLEKPFEKRLEIVGVGYQATLANKVLTLQVGYANPIKLPVPADVECEVPAPTQIVVRSINRASVGQFAANIRRVRPPEPYKGKGIRYVGEYVRRKAGKAFGS